MVADSDLICYSLSSCCLRSLSRLSSAAVVRMDATHSMFTPCQSDLILATPAEFTPCKDDQIKF